MKNFTIIYTSQNLSENMKTNKNIKKSSLVMHIKKKKRKFEILQ